MTNTNHSLPKGTSDEHYTPLELFERLGVKFDLDVAAPHARPNSNPTQWFCKCCSDGLTNKWLGNVWMNPPYSNPTPWVEKFLDHGKGIALLPITRGRWWDKMWEASDAILPLPYNYKFDRPDGMPSKPIVFRTALYALGLSNAEALHSMGLAK
jgi:hypothetical protein